MSKASRSPTSEKPSWKAWIKPVVRVVVILLVAWGIYHAVHKAQVEMRQRRATLRAEIAELTQQIEQQATDELRRKLAEHERQLAISPWAVRPSWLLAAAVFYVLGLLPNAIFWRSILRAMGADPHWLPTLRAYYIGHLGKYVPGKAMVVVLRASLISSAQTSPAVAALAVFVETLTMMAVGGMLASLILVIFFPHPLMLAMAVCLVAAAGVPTLPPVFRRLVRALKIKKADPGLEAALEGLNYSLMLRGWPLVACGWILLGFSLWATLHALPVVPWSTFRPLANLPVLTAAVALAMVLGFVSLLPGGAAVREWVVTTLVAPLPGIGAYPALAAAIWLRIIWLVSEAAISFILYLIPASTESAALKPPDLSEPSAPESS